jgi:hypothetical protein
MYSHFKSALQPILVFQEEKDCQFDLRKSKLVICTPSQYKLYFCQEVLISFYRFKRYSHESERSHNFDTDTKWLRVTLTWERSNLRSTHYLIMLKFLPSSFNFLTSVEKIPTGHEIYFILVSLYTLIPGAGPILIL